ncbi:MAG: bifunctional 4-hydroxy-2-oxoglutarate aldolase/2-dehydro-3-deoxy-phosphogluconate aldolase [Actinomycetales bacterium]
MVTPAEDTAPFLDRMRAAGVVAILRGTDPQAVVDAGRALLEAGISALEVSLTTPGAVDAIRELLASAPAGSLVGAGTVLTVEQAAAVIGCGAQFAVTPALSAGVGACVEAGLPVAAGALTPTEVLTALQSGVAAVKVFPASVFGPGYVKALRDPFPDAPLVPVGGVGIDDVPAYLQAGAVAVGVGNPLVGDAVRGGDLTALRDRAARYLAAAHASHQASSSGGHA